jgi:hypothetical protein
VCGTWKRHHHQVRSCLHWRNNNLQNKQSKKKYNKQKKNITKKKKKKKAKFQTNNLNGTALPDQSVDNGSTGVVCLQPDEDATPDHQRRAYPSITNDQALLQLYYIITSNPYKYIVYFQGAYTLVVKQYGETKLRRQNIECEI